MKVALIDRTGLRELPLAAALRRRGHHVVLISRKDRAPFAPGIDLARCEHHRIGLDDTAQLVTAFQHCAAVVVCIEDFPGASRRSDLEPAEERILREACRRAAVPQLTRLHFARTRTAPAASATPRFKPSHAA